MNPPFDGAERVACIATALQSTHRLGHTVIFGNKVVVQDAIKLGATLGLTAQLLCTVKYTDTNLTPQMAFAGKPNNVRLYMLVFTRSKPLTQTRVKRFIAYYNYLHNKAAQGRPAAIPNNSIAFQKNQCDLAYITANCA